MSVLVLPDSFEYVKYAANVRGDWVLRHNTLAFFAENVNNVVLEISYRRKQQAAYEALREDLHGADVEVEQNEEGIRLTLLGTVLFASGSADLTDAGQELLAKVAQTIKARDDLKVSVAGHTDSTPVTGELASIYQTNWELSAARSLAVVRHLADQGVPEKQLEARAYGEHQPRVSNETAEGRAQNRRIEVHIVEVGSSEG